MKFLVVLQTHTVSSNEHQKEQLRYCGAKKPEVTKRCVRSLLAAVKYARNLLPQVQFEIKVFDDHSDSESLRILKKDFHESGLQYDIEALETKGIMPSILRCYQYGRDHGQDLVYFVQDDYLYFETCLFEMVVDCLKFTEIVQSPISIFPYNDPYRYSPHNLVEKVHVFQGCKRFWRTNFHPSSCFMVPHSVLVKEWDLFQAMGTSKIYSGMEQDTIGQLFIKRNYVLFTPLPSLALHMQLETERDPFLDWKPLWEKFADVDVVAGSAAKPFTLPEGKILLNVGCGRTRLDLSKLKEKMTEVRVDSDPEARADVQGSIQDLKNIPAKSVATLYASHVLEHVHWHELFAVMKEFQRVVCDDGFALVAVPNLEYIADGLKGDGIIKAVYRTEPGDITPLDMIYGFRDFVARGMEGMQHKTGFNSYLLERVFRDSGWKNVVILDQGTQITAIASQGKLPEDVGPFLEL